MKDLKARIESIKAKQAEITKVENEFETVRTRVSEIWKEYFPLAERKKEMSAKLKEMRAELQMTVESDKELNDLLSSIK